MSLSQAFEIVRSNAPEIEEMSEDDEEVYDEEMDDDWTESLHAKL